MANGLDIERAFFDQLSARGFQIAPPNDRLDRAYKVDRVVLGPPASAGACFFPPPIAVQLTMVRDYWGKRAAFVTCASAVASRLAYIELHEGAVTEEVLATAHAALLQLFYNPSAPRVAIIILRANRYELRDLEAELPLYRKWVETKIEGEIKGVLDYWDSERGYGFVLATVLGPTRALEEAAFFIHHTSISDPELQQWIKTRDGTLQGGDRLRVVFQDGISEEESEVERKPAVQVRRQDKWPTPQ